MLEYLKELNERQREAVLHSNGPLLILAGAGAGKTKTLTARIAHLIYSGVSPSNILAVTFTNKAAGEMRERVRSLLSNRELGTSEVPFTATFHGLGVSILKEHARMFNVPRNFTIFDRSDSLRAVKEAQKRADVDPKRFEPRKILGAISRAKGSGMTRIEYEQEASEFFPRMVSDVWKRYEALLKKEAALDFDDLLLLPYRLLNENPAIATQYQEQFPYIHIDEYQDTNGVQFALSKILAGKTQNICVVGDIDQNIYSWRGADIEHLLSFEENFPKTKTVILEENYRSTQTILKASNAIIEKNVRRKEKTLFTRSGEGDPISIYGAYDESDESNFVVSTASRLIAEGAVPSGVAVLYRANFQSRALEEAFLYAGVPYQVLGTRFFERKEVKDVLSFVRASLNPNGSADIARITNTPPRGIGKVTLLAMVSGKVSELPPKARERVENFYALLKKIRELIGKEKPSQVIRNTIRLSGLEAHFLKGNEEDKERLGNIKELVTLATKYDEMPYEEGIEKLLEDAALASDQDSLLKEEKGVKLMTVHASKGLEFDTVFITGLEDGLFPHASDDETRDDEEERRLFYVALTRARKKVFLSFASVRTIFGSKEISLPSEFLSDLDPSYCENETTYEKEKDQGDTIYIE